MRRTAAFAAVILLIAATVTADEGGCGRECRRQPFFGDLHVHTDYSVDAFVFDVTNGPREAYVFAQGGEAGLTPVDANGEPTRKWKLRERLDFAAVTDHAEGFGLSKICTTPGTPGYDSPECQVLRRDIPVPSRTTLLLLIGYVGLVPPNVPFTCRDPRNDCDAAADSIWQDTQDAAAEFYRPGEFTTFVAYEWTAMPGTANLHRNVIFRNEKVPDKPTSYFETELPDERILWAKLEETCLDAVPGCEALTIPHNSNLSAGLMFPDPQSVEEAEDRAIWEPLVEITQHKGASECRFDRTYGSGVDTTDEQCAFEQLPGLTLFPVPGPANPPPPVLFPRRSFVRNVLKDGLALEQKLGVNPFRLGIIGSTDTHNGTPGNTDELGFPGHAGNQDDAAQTRMTDGGVARTNPGGLAVVWAEDNTRDSIFAALRRRETYGTSGTRPIVRFFGGWGYDDDLCEDPSLVRIGYRRGVPMGSDLPSRPRRAEAPKFVAWAMKSKDLPDLPGTPLERIQIVKGWVDGESGMAEERVYDVTPKQQGFEGAVDPGTCRAVETGSPELCDVWTDPDFDPAEPAFYYARVLEDPTCRWSTYDCRDLGVDPFADDCLVKAVTAKPGVNLTDCCPARIDPVVQERAWTSPIWYRPAP